MGKRSRKEVEDTSVEVNGMPKGKKSGLSADGAVDASLAALFASSVCIAFASRYRYPTDI